MDENITAWMEELSIALGCAHPIPKSDLKMRKLDASIADPTVC
jgi:hypothetical protein